MKEVIVEGLEAEDFVVLEKIIRSYKVSIDDLISFQEVQDIYTKVKQVLDYLQE